MKLIWAICAINVAWVCSDHSYNYEKMNHFGFGRRIIPRVQPSNLRFHPTFETNQHPSPLPPPKKSLYDGSSPHNLYQGIYRKGDKRVFNSHFDYPMKNQGQQVLFRGDHNCILSRLSVDTERCLPTLLRGGAGHRFFLIVVRAKANVAMKGRVRAWCRNSSEFYSPGDW